MGVPEQSPLPPPDRPAGDAAPEARKKWMDDLARRSAGIEPYVAPKERRGPGEKSPWTYAGLGLEFGGITAIFALMGYYIDHRWNTVPWGTLIMSTIGVVGSMYLFIKGALKYNADPRGANPPEKPRQG